MLTDPADDWADAIALSLPPMTATEAVVVGRLAAALDARRTTSTTPPRPARWPAAKAPARKAA